MMHATPFRELAPAKVRRLREQYMPLREQLASNLFRHHIQHISQPLPSAWSGLGPIPNSSEVHLPVVSFAAYTMDEHEWQMRVNMAATCRLISRLNNHKTFEGSFAHFSMSLGDGTYLLVPPAMPFAAVRASMLVVVDDAGR